MSAPVARDLHWSVYAAVPLVVLPLFLFAPQILSALVQLFTAWGWI